MDQHELIKMAIMAAMGALFREVIVFVVKRSKTVAAVLARVTANILRHHWRLVLAFVDLGIAFICLIALTSQTGDQSPATKSFAAYMALFAVGAVTYLLHFARGVESYTKQRSNQGAAPNPCPAPTAQPSGESQESPFRSPPVSGTDR